MVLFVSLIDYTFKCVCKMKKIIYILSLFIAVLLLDSCSKERVTKCNDIDPFATEENDLSRGQLGGGNGGGIIDPDKDDDDMDEDDQIVDPDEDDDDMDDDDEESNTDDQREGSIDGEGV